MAEVITILGVASSIVQLVDAVTKLRSICGTFKDASSELADLVSEISISAKQLNRSKEYFEKASILDVDLVSECLEYLQQALLAVNTVSNEMQKTLNRGKTIGSMKFVWKSGQIQKIETETGACTKAHGSNRKTSRSCRTRTCDSSQLQVIRFNSELLLQVLEQGKHATQSNVVQQPSLPPITPQLALESLNRTPMSELRRVSRKREYKIALPQWLWSKTFRLALRQQQSSINLTLRCYNSVSVDSAIYNAVSDGNVDTVKHLFATGQASLFDTFEGCLPLLNLATFLSHSSLCRFLVSQGAEVDYVDHDGMSVLTYLLLGFVYRLNFPEAEQIEKKHDMRKVTNTEMIELMEVLSEPVSSANQGLEEIPTEVADDPMYWSLRNFLLKGELSNASLVAPEDRARLITWTDSLDMVEYLLASDLSAREVFTYAKNDRLTHRNHLAVFFAASDEERHRWSWYIQEWIAFDQSQPIEDFRCPMHERTSLVAVCFRPWSHIQEFDLSADHSVKTNRNLRKFLGFLQGLGADLESLGQKEQCMFRHQGGYYHRYRDPITYLLDFGWKITNLETGHQPTDWKIWLAPYNCEYEWAGRFWHWTEHPELYIPGSFIEDGLW